VGRNTYRELSATALIAAGLMHGVRCAYLEKEFLNPAVKAFRAVADSIREDEKECFCPKSALPPSLCPFSPALDTGSLPEAKTGFMALPPLCLPPLSTIGWCRWG